MRWETQAIPALRHAFSTALDQIDVALGELRRSGNLSAPWLGDETSSTVAAHYNRRAMTDPDSSYRSLEQYRNELLRIHDTLQQMEEAYRRGESGEVARWGPRT
jgi:hypothetical protein